VYNRDDDLESLPGLELAVVAVHHGVLLRDRRQLGNVVRNKGHIVMTEDDKYVGDCVDYIN
jgi:hypothetical protein